MTHFFKSFDLDEPPDVDVHCQFCRQSIDEQLPTHRGIKFAVFGSFEVRRLIHTMGGGGQFWKLVHSFLAPAPEIFYLSFPLSRFQIFARILLELLRWKARWREARTNVHTTELHTGHNAMSGISVCAPTNRQFVKHIFFLLRFSVLWNRLFHSRTLFVANQHYLSNY